MKSVSEGTEDGLDLMEGTRMFLDTEAKYQYFYVSMKARLLAMSFISLG